MVSTEETNSAVSQMTKHSVAVELDFVNPFVPARWVVDQRRKLRRDKRRHRSFARPGDIDHLFLSQLISQAILLTVFFISGSRKSKTILGSECSIGSSAGTYVQGRI